jgi:hypothetical protein
MIVGLVIVMLLMAGVAYFRLSTAYKMGKLNHAEGRAWWKPIPKEERQAHIFGTPWVPKKPKDDNQ